MTNAYKDENGIPTLIAVLNTDGSTIKRVLCNPTNHALKVTDNTTGSDHGPANAKKDENFVSCIMAVSSADGFTPVSLYTDSSGNLLIQSS